mmetsp:Transcript_19003/g.55164  ORF Transcript_19003/g.55164 Transcript_19003/m.55164 type:complete len:211 (+) Transcript_19003:372-1004(+)
MCTTTQCSRCSVTGEFLAMNINAGARERGVFFSPLPPRLPGVGCLGGAMLRDLARDVRDPVSARAQNLHVGVFLLALSPKTALFPPTGRSAITSRRGRSTWRGSASRRSSSWTPAGCTPHTSLETPRLPWTTRRARSGSSICPPSESSPAAPRTISGRWGPSVRAGRAPRYTTIGSAGGTPPRWSTPICPTSSKSGTTCSFSTIGRPTGA